MAAGSAAADIASGSARHSRSSETLCFCYQEYPQQDLVFAADVAASSSDGRLKP
jgi:hypothetical protein